MNPLDKAINDALHVCPFDEAENITGKSHKKDKATDSLAFFILQENVKDREALLELDGDTTFHNKLDRYLGVCDNLGFKLVLTVPFGKAEKQCFLYKTGCLLVLDTGHDGKEVNGSSFYYNWTPKSGFAAHQKEPWVLSSGCWNKEGDDDGIAIWHGDHDGREALKRKLRLLEQYGSFIVPWRYRPFGSLCHYQDYRDTDHIMKEQGWTAFYKATDKITEARILLLPKEIQDIIPPERNR